MMEFTLRPWRADDVDNLVKYANNHNISKNLTNAFPHPYSLDDAQKFISRVSQADPIQVMAIDFQGDAIGGLGIHPQADVYCKNAELGYWLAEPFWGNGIMTKAVKQMIDYGFKSFDIERIYARPFEGNLGSMKVLERAGFTLEAHLKKTFYKEGMFLDERIYAVRRN